ncbi:MAG: hypothetical protein Q8934_10815 [Bacillota bacterium]|nr:hypothetical protein [Bacillota bacterium]
MRKIPFPQANNLQLIYDIFITLDYNGTSKFEVMEKCKLTEREAAYYLDALQYLGLVNKQKMRYFLNNEGEGIKNLLEGSTKRVFALKILENPFLRELYDKSKLFINKKECQEYIAGRIAEKESLNVITSMRRASTVVSWFTWVDKYK